MITGSQQEQRTVEILVNRDNKQVMKRGYDGGLRQQQQQQQRGSAAKTRTILDRLKKKRKCGYRTPVVKKRQKNVGNIQTKGQFKNGR